MTPRRPASSQSGTRRVAGGARPRQVPAERAASAAGSGSGSSGSRQRGLPTAVPERTPPPRVVIPAVGCLLAFVVLHGLLIFAFSRLWLAAFQLHAVAAAQLFMTVSGFRFSWVITAALYFVLGCYACRHRWFTPGGYVPGRFWLAAALVCLMLYILTPAV